MSDLMYSITTSTNRQPAKTVIPRDEQSLGVYFHWPFCLSKCPYCDFNSHVATNVDHVEWRTALLTETRRMASYFGNRRIDSIFFGGGTPSLLEPRTVSALLELVAHHWTIDDRVEITLEANPTSADARRFRDFQVAGINRLSLGVQALDDDSLCFLGRDHTSHEAILAAELAQKIFQRTSIDLIYARPQQEPGAWRAELEQALSLVDDHISLYQLTIEKGTAFYDAERHGKLALPTDELALSLYEITQELLAEAGLPAYEISNHARPGAESRHNLTYWRYQDYLGIGPGAHSRIMVNSQIQALEQIRSPTRWINAVTSGGDGSLFSEYLSGDQCIREMVIMGLRLKTGLDRAWFARRLGVALNDAIDLSALSRLDKAGLTVTDDVGIRLSTKGYTLLDSVVKLLLP